MPGSYYLRDIEGLGIKNVNGINALGMALRRWQREKEQALLNIGSGADATDLNFIEGSLNSGFSAEEIAHLKKVVIDEGQALKDMGLTNNQLGPAIAGAYDKSTGKIY